MKGEQRQFSLVPGRDVPRRLSRRRLAAERRDVTKGAPDGAQVLDELVVDEQGLTVEALDQLTQPVDFHLVYGDWVVVALAVEEAVCDLRALAGRDQRRNGLDAALADGGKQLILHG